MSEKDPLAVRLARAVCAMPPLGKAAHNDATDSDYIPLDAILRVLRPTLHAEGLDIRQPVTLEVLKTRHGEEHAQVVNTEIFPREDPFNSVTIGSWVVPSLDGRNGHSVGGSVTYARRYSLLAYLCIVEADDDGNSATAGRSRPARTAPPPEPTPTPEDELRRLKNQFSVVITNTTKLKGDERRIVAEVAQYLGVDAPNEPGVEQMRAALFAVNKMGNRLDEWILEQREQREQQGAQA